MTGAFCGLAVFGIVAHLLLLMGASVDAWWLPASLLVGGLIAWRQPRQQLAPAAAGRAWVLWVTVVLPKLAIPPQEVVALLLPRVLLVTVRHPNLMITPP